MCVFAIWLYFKYEEISYYSSAYNSALYDKSVLQSEISALKSEIDSLNLEIDSLNWEVDSLNSEVDSLEEENSTLQNKADWFDRNCKIVIADEGALYKTYHTFDCKKTFDKYWVYNNEQIIHKSEYKRCPDCN